MPLIYDKYRRKHGGAMTYEDNPTAHLRTEFGFDVIQLARGQYEPQDFRDFVGFEVSRPLLERAFLKTYGLRFQDVFADLDLSIGTFRFAVSSAIPAMTKIACQTKQKEIERLARRPNFLHKTRAVLLRVVPRIGPFKVLAFRTPTPEAERLFLKSFDATVDRYRALIDAAGRGRLSLQNLNLDTGRPVKPGEYRLADNAYARLVESLAQQQFAHVTAPLRSNLLDFYADRTAPDVTKRHHARWTRITHAIDTLRSGGPILEGR